MKTFFKVYWYLLKKNIYKKLKLIHYVNNYFFKWFLNFQNTNLFYWNLNWVEKKFWWFSNPVLKICETVNLLSSSIFDLETEISSNVASFDSLNLLWPLNDLKVFPWTKRLFLDFCIISEEIFPTWKAPIKCQTGLSVKTFLRKKISSYPYYYFSRKKENIYFNSKVSHRKPHFLR